MRAYVVKRLKSIRKEKKKTDCIVCLFVCGAGRGRLSDAKVSSLANELYKKSRYVTRSSHEPPIIRRTVVTSFLGQTKKQTVWSVFCLWRRKRDSNPRGLSPKRFSSFDGCLFSLVLQ